MSSITATPLSNPLQTMLVAGEIKPGDAPSYQLCKTIAAYHPLGAKMSDSPIAMAQSQDRLISVSMTGADPKGKAAAAATGPEDRLREAFMAEWKAIGADRHIFNTARTARMYGVATLALLTEGVDAKDPVRFDKLWDSKIGFNVFDPLNTAGSLVLNQNPNAVDFQKVLGVAVAGQVYNRSRTVTMMNEDPLYIEYTASAFGYVGRSVYQRALYPLQSYIQTMVTDNMVSLKAGVLVAKVKQAGSIVDRAMAAVGALKRQMVKEAVTENVLQIDTTEEVESLNLQNLEGPATMARKNILENIATAADMPAAILNQETFAEGFGEGTEDAKKVAQFVSRIRVWMDPLYDFMDKVVMYRAWNAEFYKTIQSEFPDEYKGLSHTEAFYRWRNSFRAEWPNLLEEPDSEKVKVDDVRLKAVIAMVEVLAPMVDPENKAKVIEWACDNFNELKLMFGSPLILDYDDLRNYVPPTPAAEPDAPRPFADSEARAARAKAALADAVTRVALAAPTKTQ